MRHSHATHDLYNHIGSGKTADWDFFIQVMDKAEGDSGKYGFDPLDCTKVWFLFLPMPVIFSPDVFP